MAHLEISLFGGFQVKRDGESVSGFDSIKTRALLSFLALEADKPHTRDELAALLWSEPPDTIARGSLRQALNNLQRTLHNRNAHPPYVSITRHEIQFNVAAHVRIDVIDFSARLQATATHAHTNIQTCEPCMTELSHAVAIYCGDLLPQFFVNDSPIFEEWLLLTRERYHHAALNALNRLMRFYQQRGEAGRSDTMHFAQRLLELEPWHEAAHRALMQAFSSEGRISAALEQYETLRRTLAEAFGVEPSAETNALYTQIKHSHAHTQRLLNLPAALTPFVGRANELQTMAERFDQPECRLLTLVGPGGIGKTRLAVHYATQHGERTRADVCFVACEALTQTEELPDALANAAQMQVTGGENQVLDFFRAQTHTWLVVLDNLEQIRDARIFVAKLLRATPHILILITSRERLNVEGEWVLEIGGLDLPRDETRLDTSDAGQLVLATAQRVGRTDVNALSETERHAVAKICRLTEGMPLALELAGGECEGVIV
ncbi:MAG: hypothetical protein HZB51_17185 [Chloroflexi bacterium]|nr:hypothetical protein [Chloroflexota bacterium]